MATRKKPEGIEALTARPDPVPLEEIKMLDWYAAFALLGSAPLSSPEATAKQAFDQAEAMMNERQQRM